MSHCRLLRAIPLPGLSINGELRLWDCAALKSLPEGLVVGTLYISGRGLERLPAGLLVKESLVLHGCDSLQELPEGLFVGRIFSSDASVMRIPRDCFIGIIRRSRDGIEQFFAVDEYRRETGQALEAAQGTEPFDMGRLLDRMSGAALLDADPDERIGTLIHVRGSPREPLALLRVRCATTGRYHVLRVPPECPTARAANAWTWGLSAEEYRPVSEA